jgi:2Fe-2S type ferredoxin
MVTTLGVVAGAGLALVFVAFHFMKGTESPAPDDIAQEVLEHRASTVAETDFPEPYSRAIGGGAGAGAIAAGEAEGELEEGEAEEDVGFDPSSIPEDEVEYFDVEFVKEGETIEVASNESILDAGEDEGWDLPYACREGQCLSCGGHITDGDAHEYVQHSNNETLGDDEMEKGYVLTCTAYPKKAFSIETSETP